jgi:flap endonuclease-1
MDLAVSEEDKIKYFKRSSQITKEQWDQCRDLLDMMGVPYINAPEEADSQCAYLAKMGFVDSVFTEDMDILTFGSPKIIRNLTSHKVEVSEINLVDILNQFELNYEQFVEFCILLGSDYCLGIRDINTNVLLEYYLKYKNLEDTLEAFKKDNIKVPEDFNYEEIKNYFLNPQITEVSNENIMLKEPNIPKLLKKLVEEYGLIKYLIKSKLDKLLIYYKNIIA